MLKEIKKSDIPDFRNRDAFEFAKKTLDEFCAFNMEAAIITDFPNSSYSGLRSALRNVIKANDLPVDVAMRKGELYLFRTED